MHFQQHDLSKGGINATALIEVDVCAFIVSMGVTTFRITRLAA